MIANMVTGAAYDEDDARNDEDDVRAVRQPTENCASPLLLRAASASSFLTRYASDRPALRPHDVRVVWAGSSARPRTCISTGRGNETGSGSRNGNGNETGSGNGSATATELVADAETETDYV